MTKMTYMEEITKVYQDGFAVGYKQFDIDKKRSKEKHQIETAIVKALVESTNLQQEARTIFDIWIEDEEGNAAIDRLVNLIIY